MPTRLRMHRRQRRHLNNIAWPSKRADDHSPVRRQRQPYAGTVCVFSGKIQRRKYDCDQTVYGRTDL